jgi:ribosomal protein S27AE
MAKLRRIRNGQLEYASTRQPPRCGLGLLMAPHPNFVAEGSDQDADEYREGKAEENFPADP